MKVIRNGMILAFLSLFLMGCMDDDGYSLGDFWLTTGTVVKTDGYFYIATDDGEKLWPSATNVNPAYLNDSLRVIVNYTILGDATSNEIYDYYVKINSLEKILTKPIFNFTPETTQQVKDSIGNDAVTITDTWFTGKYLNVEFKYGGGPGYIHFINLVKDTEDLQTENGEIILELKHSKNGDPYNYLQWGVASFDLSELKVDGQSSAGIFIRALDKEGEYKYNKVLTFDYQNVMAQSGKFRTIEFVTTFR